jgi:tRNA threonylcarbamoyladenosine biosynthesis protein TsaB
MLLAIDTATRIMSLALHDGHNLLAEETWHTANNHTAELAPAIHGLLERSEWSMGDLKALAVAAGPGSFTGLRIGIALAKGIASARKLPLIGVSTLDIVAAAQPQYTRHALVAVVEAGRGRIIAATYRWDKTRWVNRGESRLMDWATLLANIDGPAYIAGDIDEEGRIALDAAEAAGVPVRVTMSALRLRRAGFLAEIALERLAESGTEAFYPALLAPIYVQTRDVP